MPSGTMTTTTIRNIDLSEPSKGKKFDFSAIFHSFDEEVPPTDFVGGIFPRKHVSIIASKAGAGKTWYILKLLTDLSRGGTIFLSQAYYEPPRSSLLFCGETGVHLVMERAKKLQTAGDYSKIALVEKLEAARHGLLLNINTEDGINAIAVICRKIPCLDLIAFDTLMSFRDDDENTAKDTSLMMQRLQALAENNNAAVIVTHHVRKSPSENKSGGRVQRIDQDEIIGSSALVRQSACAYILTKHVHSVYKLTSVKTWFDKKPEFMYKMLEDGTGHVYFTEACDDDWTNSRLKIENYIASHEKGQQITIAEVKEHFAGTVPPATVERIVAKKCEKVSHGIYVV